MLHCSKLSKRSYRGAYTEQLSGIFGEIKLKLPESCYVYVAKLPSKKLPATVAQKSPSGLLWATSRSKHQRYRHYHDITAVFLPANLLKMADFKWTDEKTEDLISMYECRPWLYNVKLKEYSNRDKRKKGMEEIAKHFGLSGKLTRVGCVQLKLLPKAAPCMPALTPFRAP